MPSGRARVLVSWSSGKDSAWALHVLRQRPEFEIVGLITTLNETSDRVAMHGVRRCLVEAQASAAGLPLWIVPLPFPCSNVAYEERMRAAIGQACKQGVTHIAFGDLYLEDVRAYRTRLMAGTGVEPLFPLWCSPRETPRLARNMLRAGLRAVLTCVDPRQLSESFAGRLYDRRLLEQLPATVDPCGERGEFHTFCYKGPMFDGELPVQVGRTVCRQGFCFVDVTLLKAPLRAGSRGDRAPEHRSDPERQSATSRRTSRAN